jgi:hypothetical protein
MGSREAQDAFAETLGLLLRLRRAGLVAFPNSQIAETEGVGSWRWVQ